MDSWWRAAICGDVDTLRTLAPTLERRQLHSENPSGLTALDLAVMNGHPAAVEFLRDLKLHPRSCYDAYLERFPPDTQHAINQALAKGMDWSDGSTCTSYYSLLRTARGERVICKPWYATDPSDSK